MIQQAVELGSFAYRTLIHCQLKTMDVSCSLEWVQNQPWSAPIVAGDAREVVSTFSLPYTPEEGHARAGLYNA